MSRATEQFEIQTRLAIGDAGLVYRAADKAGRVVALKLLLTEGQVAHPLDVEALLRDAPQLQTVTGVNIVQLLDAFPDEDGTVLVYECAEGHRGLDVPAKRPISAAHAVDIAAQLLSALRSGERQRYPHGDLKASDTVIIDLPEGRPLVMVLDWGLANYRPELSPESYAYTAPERFAGGPPSHVADLFSAGAVLYYLFTGKRLLPCSTKEEFIAAWPSLDVNALGMLRPDLPKGLIEWVAKLLAPDPAMRVPSAVAALESLAALQPPLPPAVPERIRPKIVRTTPPQPPVSAIRPAPRPTPTQTETPPSAAEPVDTQKVIADAKKEVARLAKKRQMLSLASMLLLFFACAGMGGVFLWKNRIKKQADNPVDPPSRLGTPKDKPTLANKVPEAPPPKADKPAPPKATPAPEPSSYFAIDGFEYPPGSKLAGMSGGTGWAGPWTVNFDDLVKVEAGSLAFAKAPTVGEKVILNPSPKPADPAAPPPPPNSTDLILTRFLPPKAVTVDPKKPNVFFFRITLQHSDTPFSPESEFQFNAFDPSDVKKPIRTIIGDQGAGFEISMNDRKVIKKVPNDNKPLCVVQRFELKPEPGGKWTLESRVFINPNPDSPAPPLHDLEFTKKGLELPKQFGVVLRKKPTPTTRIDEVRFAHRWVGLFR